MAQAGTDAQIFKTENDDPRAKYYVVEMFPYPPGRIHMGYVRNYPMCDVARAIGPRAASSRAESPLEWVPASFRPFFVRRCFDDWLVQLFNDRRTLSCNSDCS
jgi:hypothetical protein